MAGKQLDELISETLETVLVDYCLGLEIPETEAFVIFVQATQRRQGTMRMASHWVLEGADSLAEYVPDAVKLVTRMFTQIENPDEESLIANTERAIMALFLGTIEAMGRHLIELEASLEGGP